ncbi:phenylalanine--tRNA ligase subunit beta [Candidatus Schneideria nysicola]|uniref:phenylalanine--tRNA ligase subunit beta n=1 Tax=Candidatus Schneideria nysicola TaxID=1081631 RepID=UPI001CAA6A58|nr:phenylalanine--tRNA ligase subunit beta [Candidatus Schneideria nysicola]UAJ65737.1 phenylalanine--tRNA ligase subunit beta [Candidatus Schneideria nysicola]
MKLSEFWLREWINPPIDINLLTEKMTMIGLEVEDIEYLPNQLYGDGELIVGKIIECKKVSFDEQDFFFTRIDISRSKPIDIFCKKFHGHIGQKVVVSTTFFDTTLPLTLSIENLPIKNEGILCSFEEIGIPTPCRGFIRLPNDAIIGSDVRNYLQLDDNILNINITFNRPDCLSIQGITRDIAAYFQLPINRPKIPSVIPVIKDILQVNITVPEVCPHYLSRIIKDVDITTITPFWIKERLRRCGISSINIIADIANYVMIELGQPISIFDLQEVGNGITIRMARSGETIKCRLHEEFIRLTTETLILANEQGKILSLAGITTNDIVEKKNNIRDIVLLSIFFDPLAIRNRAHHKQLQTESTLRYERGVDPTIQNLAIERTTTLLLSICGGKAGPIINITNKKGLPNRREILFNRYKIKKLLGYTIPNKNICRILDKLGFEYIPIKNGWKIVPPSWRYDISMDVDIIEELARIYGYHDIPSITPLYIRTIIPHHKETFPLERIKIFLVDRGYQEVITYSFVSNRIQNIFHPNHQSLSILNALSKEMSVMRLSLFTGIINTIVYNQNRQQNRIRLFESGLCFIPDKTVELQVRQDLILAGAITGPRSNINWINDCQIVDFYDIKGDIESLLTLINLDLNHIEFKSDVTFPSFLHPGKSASIFLDDEQIGVVGMIHPNLEQELNLKSHTFVFEILLHKISTKNTMDIRDISRFPANRRDISLIVSQEIQAGEIIKECKNTLKDKLVNINIFDVYSGEPIKQGFKSLSISLILQDYSRTLGEVEIVEYIETCKSALKKRFQAFIRE